MPTLLAPILGLLIGQTTTAQEVRPDLVPKILVDAFMQRMAFKTARFTLRIEQKRRLLQPFVRRFSFEWAHGAQHIVDLGDDHGLRQNGDTDEVLLGVEHRAEPLSYFINATNDESWSYFWGRVDHFPPGISSPYRYSYPDPRSYGLLCGDIMPVSPEKFLDSFRDSKSPGQFEVNDSGPGCTHVRYIGPEGRGGHSETEWWIAVAKGPSVTQVRHSYVRIQENAEVFADLTSTVELIDGYWWPRRVEGPQAYFGKDRTCVVTFEDVEFDRPEHPQTLDADVLKIPLGTRVWCQAERTRYAGHSKVITEEEWLNSASDDEIRARNQAEMWSEVRGVGSRPDWWEDKDDAYGLKDAPTRPELWELYLRRWALKRRTNAHWIVKQPLTDDQCRAAQAILDDCRKKASSQNPSDVESVFKDFKKQLNALLTDAQRDPANAGWHKNQPRPKAKPLLPWNRWPGGPAII